MLHVFNVNKGHVLTFDVHLAMEKIDSLKSAIYKINGIHPEKQVMLIGDGQALSGMDHVCNFATGTETNPLYLFDKTLIDKVDVKHESIENCFTDFRLDLHDALNLPPTYNTVTVRTKLALRMYEAAKNQVEMMGSLVHDEHLMYQGWQAAVKNLLETVTSFKARYEKMSSQCQHILHQLPKFSNVFDGFDSIIEDLSKIEIFPTEEDFLPLPVKESVSKKLSNISLPKPKTLLQWIEVNCNGVPLNKIVQDTHQKSSYLTLEKLGTILKECNEVLEKSNDERMCEINGIGERLSALNQVIVAADQQVKELAGIVQGFTRNRETAKELQANAVNRDALLTICESHIAQLKIIQEYERSSRVAAIKCAHAKQELSTHLHSRLRWVYYIQRSLLNSDVKLCLFYQQLTQMHNQLMFVDQVKEAPSLYIKSVIEAKRRSQFSQFYLKWSNNVISAAKIARDEEVHKRREFKMHLSKHFLQKMFHGFSDKPPLLSSKPMSMFDNRLPDISDSSIEGLTKILPPYRNVLQLPNISGDVAVLQTCNIPENKRLVFSSVTMTTTTNTAVVDMVTTDSQTTFSEVTSMSISEGTSEMKNFTEESPFNSPGSPPGEIHPGGFVATSVDKIKEETGIPKNESLSSDRTLSSGPESSLKKKQDPTSGDFSSPPRDAIGDIISPESPPNSDFFSIQPSIVLPTIESPKEEKSILMQDSIRYSHLEDSDSSKINISSNLACSPDSNLSTSFHKIEGALSSDDEMFHSFTSENSREIKLLKKRLNHLRAEYEKLSDSKMRQEDENNKLVKKLREEIEEQHNDFQKRWDGAKAELDNLFAQLENEKQERKNAWDKGTKMEQNLKESQTVCQQLQDANSKLEEDFKVKSEKCSDLETQIEALRQQHENEIEKFHQEREKFCEEIVRKSDEKLQKHQRDVQHLQELLKESDDRIQELESSLSVLESESLVLKQERMEFELKCNKSEEILLQSEEGSKKTNEIILQLETEKESNEQKIKDLEENVKHLKKILADYETKISSNKVTDEQLMALSATLAKSQEDKLKLEQLLITNNEEKSNLKISNNNLSEQIDNLNSTIEEIKSSFAQEKKDLFNQNQTVLEQLKENHSNLLTEVTEKHNVEIKEYIENFEKEKEEIKNENRKMLDELEADRLQSIAQSQQDVEYWMTKEKDANRNLELRNKENEEMKRVIEELKLNCQELERYQNDYSELLSERQELERELLSLKESIRLEESKKDNNGNLMYSSSIMTSSTDEEMDTKRKKMDIDECENVTVNRNENGTISLADHNKIIQSMQKNFEHDKKLIESVYQKRQQESQRRSQMLFNSAIQRVRESKDAEISRIKDQTVSQSMYVQSTSANIPQSSSEGSLVDSQRLLAPIKSDAPPASAITSQPISEMNQSDSSKPQQPPIEMEQSTTAMTESVYATSPNSASTVTANKDREAVVISNFQVGDVVLVTFNYTYMHHTLFTSSKTLHFVHNDCLTALGIKTASGDVKKSTMPAILSDKEYCQARKAQNRFHVPINTKFYRVKVTPFNREIKANKISDQENL